MQPLSNITNKRLYKAFIVRDHDEHIKWLITNIHGWKLTSVNPRSRLIDINCYFKKSKRFNIIEWRLIHMGHSYIDIRTNMIMNKVHVKYSFRDMPHFSVIDHQLSIKEYKLQSCSNENVAFEKYEPLIVYGRNYQNVIAQYLDTDENRIVAQLHPALSHITNEDDGEIKPLKKCCYKLI